MSNSDDRFHTTSWDVGEVKKTADSQNKSGGKKKKRKKRGMNPLLGIVLWLVIVIGSSYLFASIGWLLANDLCALNKPFKEATIQISEEWVSGTKKIENADGSKKEIVVCDMKKVAEKLAEEEVIQYDWFFRLFAWFYKGDEKVKQGTYTINSDMDYMALIRAMRGVSSGSAATVDVSIPEGYSVKQIIALLAEKGVASEEALMEVAANHIFEGYAFVDNENLGDVNRLEGYLFPDTYNFYVGGKAVTALNTLLSTFNRKVYENEELAPLFEAAEERGYSMEDIITVASLIEKESDGSDRSKIASVIFNRLENAAETAHFLQIDAALVYAVGREITRDDYANLDSPYNLYKYAGLPPTPIANPGFAAINAALQPADTDYYFYVLGPDGKHIFNETLAGHQQTIAGLS